MMTVGVNAVFFFFAAIACVLTGCQISHNIYHNHHAKTRRYIIRILFMIVVYSVSAWSALFIPSISVWLNVIRDTYESLVIYSFYQLLITTLGGYHSVERQLYSIADDCIPRLFPFHHCCKPWVLNPFVFLKNTTFGVLQFCFVQFLIAIITFIMQWPNVLKYGTFEYTDGYLWTVVIRIISGLWAIYCLIVFYWLLYKKLPRDSPGHQSFIGIRPLPKLLCIKAIIFATYWQSVLINLFVFTGVIETHSPQRTARNIGDAIQNSIICVEMLFFSIAHIYAFRVSDFEQCVPGNESIMPAWKILCDVANVTDLVDDVSTISRNRHPTGMDQDDDDDEDDDDSKLKHVEHHRHTAGHGANKLKYYHITLITLINACCQLLTHSFCIFIAFIAEAYHYEYAFIVTALAIGALASSFTFLVERILLFQLKSNTVHFILCVSECVVLFLLWFRPKNGLFIMAVILICVIERVCYRYSYLMIHVFTHDTYTQHQHVLALNAANTVAAFLFIPCGFILHYLSLWNFLEILFIVFVVLCLLSLFVIPKISINSYYDYCSMNNLQSSESTSSWKDDLVILCKHRYYKIILSILTFSYLAYALFYSSVGFWIKNVYQLDAAQWGIAAGLIQGSACLMIMAILKYWRSSSKHSHFHRYHSPFTVFDGDYDDEYNDEEDVVLNENTRFYAVSIRYVMICSVAVLCLSAMLLVIFNYVAYLEQIVIYVVILLYFVGYEAHMFAVRMLSITEITMPQRRTSFVLSELLLSLATFVAQIGVGRLYENDGMRLISVLLLVVYMVISVCSIGLTGSLRAKQLESELVWINQQSVPKYT